MEEEENCIICMDYDNSSRIIQYNHCGKYYIHEKCNDKWFLKHKSCFICRNKIIDEENLNFDNNENENENENENNVNDNIDNMANSINSNNYCPFICCGLSFCLTTLSLIISLI